MANDKDDILGDGKGVSKGTEKSDVADKTGMDAKEMIERNSKEERKIKYNDRVKLEILEDTKYYKKGQIIEPHRVMAEQLIKQKTAKEVK
jgi:hypothetical protein